MDDWIGKERRKTPEDTDRAEISSRPCTLELILARPVKIPGAESVKNVPLPFHSHEQQQV
jgi:hypothetical protein